MKNSYRSIWLFALVFLCILLGCACSRKNREVLVLLGSQIDASYDELQTAARQWAEGKNISIQIVAPKLSSIYEQQKILENSIRDREWDLIVIEAFDEGSMYPLLDYARSRGSKIVSMQGMSGQIADYTIRSCRDEKVEFWDRERMLLASLEVGGKALDGRIKDTPDKLITQVEGYRTLQLLGDGIYCGNDIWRLTEED